MHKNLFLVPYRLYNTAMTWS